ncbi:hypothetical protein DFQ01_11869 [Paenibacillus cellulosilyticus]|uniref:PH (Pleckstrin Homology) domain-containing protein n=1 Tax=Paenibacillus cellulosilyticus TaxID=375489 RepID=A0A2V2YPW5_9BACL|nr:hypothetical protein [Paenibacillus cellulosilyticus]PWV98434.1 hypothetical protein DFQ01_11869 [Paenibacillus cellulosilyticus]QKS43281.1 hypothetical protein HUB94_02060 [Paenibacillus cellulosilyticus]
MFSLTRRQQAMLGDLQVFYHVFFRWGRPKENREEHVFTYHRRSMYVFLFLAILHEQVLEMVAFHYLFVQKLPATILTCTHVIHLYTILYMIGDYNLVRRGRVRLEDRQITINVGLRQSIQFNLDQIRDIRLVGGVHKFETSSSTMRVAATPRWFRSMIGVEDTITCEIVLDQPVDRIGLLGTKKRVSHIQLSLDDPSSFAQAVQQAL